MMARLYLEYMAYRYENPVKNLTFMGYKVGAKKKSVQNELDTLIATYKKERKHQVVWVKTFIYD